MQPFSSPHAGGGGGVGSDEDHEIIKELKNELNVNIVLTIMLCGISEVKTQ